MATAVAQGMTRRFDQWIGWFKALVANPQLLMLWLTLDVTAYFAGLIFWYGYVMTDPATPVWVWPFVPDCPLFGLLGGLGLLMVAAQHHWSNGAQRQGQRTLWGAALASLVILLLTFVPALGEGWREQRAMFTLWTGALVVAAVWFRQPPAWLLGIFAFGQIKYGIWTITAWLLYWRSTAAILGAPHLSFDSIAMTVAHIGLAAQGLLLLAFFRPDWKAVLAAMLWFGVSDFVDYGLGFFPAIPQDLISLEIVQWSTITVTLLLVAVYWLYSVSPIPSRLAAAHPRPQQ